MILTLLSIILCVVFMVIAIIVTKKDYFCWQSTFFMVITALTVICATIFVTCTIIAHINPARKYEKDMIEYDALQYEDTNGNYVTFYRDVVDYNTKVSGYQEYATNLWVNWFYYPGCENIPYYELDKGEK